MPDRACFPVYDKCTSCASLHGPVHGPLPTSHTEVCCLFRFARQGQSGLCEDCPSRLKFQQQQVGPAHQPPERRSGVPQEGIRGRRVTHPRKSTKIIPRMRQGFKKYTIEMRPSRFKMKLWFGTFKEEEVGRAKDAINFYMGGTDPFNHADSQRIFAEKPLGIKYEDLDPSCDQYIKVGGKTVLAYKYFARQVKEMIFSVLGKEKNPKCKATQIGASSKGHENVENIQTLLKEARTQSLNIYEPVLPCASGSTSSSADDMMVEVSGPGPEANSDPEPLHPSPSPSPPLEMLTYEAETPISEQLRLFNWDEEMFALEEGLTFLGSPSVAAPLGDYENGMVLEDNGFFANLWSD